MSTDWLLHHIAHAIQHVQKKQISTTTYDIYLYK